LPFCDTFSSSDAALGIHFGILYCVALDSDVLSLIDFCQLNSNLCVIMFNIGNYQSHWFCASVTMCLMSLRALKYRNMEMICISVVLSIQRNVSMFYLGTVQFRLRKIFTAATEPFQLLKLVWTASGWKQRLGQIGLSVWTVRMIDPRCSAIIVAAFCTHLSQNIGG
jgi:hypothetical protein